MAQEFQAAADSTTSPAHRCRRARLSAVQSGARDTAPSIGATCSPPDRVPPAMLWNPQLPGIPAPSTVDRFVRSAFTRAPLPSTDEAIAFAPVTALSRWIESKQLTSERLTQIYLSRIDRLDSKIRALITITRDHALARAQGGGA